MPEGHVLEFTGVTKRFGAVTAIDDFSARVEPGVVTGFLGPNGAGKTTSLRILLGLIAPTRGTATIGGKRYAQLAHPLQTVGAALEASSFHPGRTAANHLKVYAQAAGIPSSRIDDALGTVGLADVAGRKVGGFSLGMRQRLGLAYTLLGDPGVLVLDEPSNGLDPEGIRWMRGFLRDLARQGRTVLVSSHLLAEIQQTAEALLIISRGRLVFQGTLGDLTEQDEFATVVDSPDRAALSAALTAAGHTFELLRTGLTVRGADPATIGAVAASAGVALSSLQRRGPALEEVFLALVNGERVHASASGVTPAPASGVAEPAQTVAAPAQTPADDAPTEAEAAVPPAQTETDDAPADESRRSEEDAPAASEESPAVVAAAWDRPDTAADEISDEVDEDEVDEDEEGPAPTAATWDAGQPTTESDLEADRFFAQYDTRDEDSQPEDAATAADRPELAEDAQPEDAATAADQPEDAAAEEPEDAEDPQPESVPEPPADPAPDASPDAETDDDPHADSREEGGEPR